MLKLVIASVLCAFVVASPADRLRRADSSNPCTPQALADGKQYFAVAGDRGSFIECDLLGHPNLMNCPTGLIWDEARLGCVYDFQTFTTGSGTGIGGTGNGGTGTVNGGAGSGSQTTAPSVASLQANCSPENIAAKKLFFPHPDPTKFIECDLWGDVYVLSCPSGLTWNSNVQACDSPFLPATARK